MTTSDHITEYLVASHFLAYFINGDVTGFSDEDEALAYAFEERETAGIENFHWSYETDESGEDTGGFGKCEICNLGADRATLHLVNMDSMMADRASKEAV